MWGNSAPAIVKPRPIRETEPLPGELPSLMGRHTPLLGENSQSNREDRPLPQKRDLKPFNRAMEMRSQAHRTICGRAPEGSSWSASREVPEKVISLPLKVQPVPLRL